MKNRAILIFIFLSISILSNAQMLPQKVFEGTINGKIPIILTLNFNGNTVYGNVVYKKKGIPISVIGSLTENTLFLHELMPDGNVTGNYSADLKGNKIIGIWSAIKRDAKELPLSLFKIKEQNIPKKKVTDVTGTYCYAFGEDGGSGNLWVQQIGKDKVAISFDNITSAPAYNMAEVDKTILKLVNNQAVYSNKEYGKCKFIITFLENGARVNFADDSYDCGFGHNASTEGSYMRVNSKKPEFGN